MAPYGFYNRCQYRDIAGTMPQFHIPPEPEYVDDAIDDSTLKKEINNLIWMCAPKNIPLGKADDMACKVFEMFKEAQEKYPEQK